MKQRTIGHDPRPDVLFIDTRLIDDPAPSATTIETFFQRRATIRREHPKRYPHVNVGGDRGLAAYRAIVTAWRDATRVDLYVDPDPNAQLLLCQLIEAVVERCLDTTKLWLTHVDHRLDDMPCDAPLPACAPIRVDAIDLARNAWRAFTSDTPERWAALRATDLSALPRLRSTVERMLGELPDLRTGLAESARFLLATIGAGGIIMSDAFGAMIEQRFLYYYGVMALIHRLGSFPAPLIAGAQPGLFSSASIC